MPIFALLIWPIITIVIFRMYALRKAVICALLLGYLFLPEAFAIDLPGIPAIEKGLVISGSLLLALLFFREPTQSARLKNQTVTPPQTVADPLFRNMILGLIALLLVNSVLTIMNNREFLTFGPITITSLRPWDIVSDLTKTLVWIVPFLIGRQLLNRPEDHRMLLKLLVTMALVYSVFILIEIRLSPQLHNWVYGYHQHSFAQHIRGGQFRPKVFLDHGLSVGIFLFAAIVAAIAIWLGDNKTKATKWLLAGCFLFCLLAISRNLGAFVIAMLLLPVFFLGRAWQLRIVSIISIMFLVFPAIRQAELVPIDWITSQAAAISADRAQSFEFRIDNEDALLRRAAEKPLSGWGGWGRARIYDQYGNDKSVTDGLWIIILGTSGWLGYIALFGLLVMPLLFLRRAHKRKTIPVETIALAIVMAGILIYLVPNAHIGPIGWLMAGAIAGFVQFDTAEVTDDEKSETPQTTRRQASYTRYPVTTRQPTAYRRLKDGPRAT